MLPMPQFFEDDEFWRHLLPFLFNEERLRAAAGEVEDAIRLLGVEPGARILDLCCGPGRHTIEFARRGFSVTGVDRTACYLDVARQRAAELQLPIEIVQADMRDYRLDNAFDGAVNMWTSFGYSEDQAEDRRVLDNLYCSLKPGGRLVMDMAGREVLARIFQARDWLQAGDTLWLMDREAVDDWGRLHVRWILIENGRRTEYDFRHRVYTGTELRRLLEEAGFRDVRIYGGLNGIPYDRAAQMLVAVATKGV